MASAVELAYGILWRIVTSDKQIHLARKLLLDGLGKDGQRRGIEAAIEQLGLVGHDDGASVSDPYTRAARDVIAERLRQISEEGFTPEYDDLYKNGSLALAAACYAIASDCDDKERKSLDPSCVFWSTTDAAFVWQKMWPFPIGWWKPKDRRRDLVRAGALILAEIERLDRASAGSNEHG
jgi:hypothetical protein